MRKALALVFFVYLAACGGGGNRGIYAGMTPDMHATPVHTPFLRPPGALHMMFGHPRKGPQCFNYLRDKNGRRVTRVVCLPRHPASTARQKKRTPN